jgi:hypothetical protein
MSYTTFAERLLALLSTRQRASAIVGDLLEQNLTGSTFVAAVLGIAFRSVLRSISHFVSAFACFLCVIALYCLYVVPRWKLPHHESWVVWSVCFAGLSLCLATATGLSASRYGIHDRLTRGTAWSWLLVTASACLAWLPHVLFGIVPALVALIIYLLRHASARRLLRGVIAPAAAFSVTAGVFYLFSRLTLMPATAKASTVNLAFVFCAGLAGLFVESAIMERVQQSLTSDL